MRSLAVRQITLHVADAAARWRDADYPPRVRATAALERRLGYTTPVVDYALDQLFGGITCAAIESSIAAELGSLDVLDGDTPRAIPLCAWARGADRVVIVSSDATIGVAIAPLVFALCAKSNVVVKDRSDLLVAAFAATLAEEHPAFAQAIVSRAWAGGADAEEDALFAHADVVVAFGRDDTLRAIRARCGVDTRFVPFGHRVSIGRLTRDDLAHLDEARADAIMRDALLYDGEGCLSLHALFIESGGAAAFAHTLVLLAAAAERISIEFPAAALAPARAAALAAYRGLAQFRAASGTGSMLRAGDATLVVAACDTPPPLLPRVLPIVAVSSDDDVVAYARAHRLPVQALGAARPSTRDVALAEGIGAVRVAAFGTMQHPPLCGHHGGRPRIADFVRWIDCA